MTGRDDLCAEVPALADALDDGRISGGHLDAITAAARDLPADVRGEFLALADDLLARAGGIRLDGFVRECRQLAKHLLAMSRRGDDVDELAAQRQASKLERWVDRQTGMHHTHLALDAERDAQLHSAMTVELARLRQVETAPRRDWEQLKVEAFLHAVCGIATPTSDVGGIAAEPACRCGGSVDRVPEITALVDYRWLIGQVDDGVCETDHGVDLPIATLRRLAYLASRLLHRSGEFQSAP